MRYKRFLPRFKDGKVDLVEAPKRGRERGFIQIPAEWVNRLQATAAPAWALACAIWNARPDSKDGTIILTREYLQSFGVTRHSARGALEWLENAMLIEVLDRRAECQSVRVRRVDTG
jgi:hypothetical protein